MKITATLAAFTVAALCSVPLTASADACGTELCLSNLAEAKKDIGRCKSDMDEFFAIVETKRGKFSPSRTLDKRRQYLNKCNSGPSNQPFKDDILSKYGSIEGAPY